jgi:hypothetical protein
MPKGATSSASASERPSSALARGVGAEPGDPDLTVEAAHLGDRTAAAFAHVRKHCSDQRRRPEEVIVHDLPQLLVAGLLDGADVAVAGIVDEHVDAIEVADRHLDDLLDVARVGDVEGGGAHALAPEANELGQRTQAARAGDHGVAGGERGTRDLGAEPDEVPVTSRTRPVSVAVLILGTSSSHVACVGAGGDVEHLAGDVARPR